MKVQGLTCGEQRAPCGVGHWEYPDATAPGLLPSESKEAGFGKHQGPGEGCRLWEQPGPTEGIGHLGEEGCEGVGPRAGQTWVPVFPLRLPS